ncbi:hypothetical protein SEA_MAYA_62 [Streptomyces phage Maya]|nr:hypothetical protein SEA_SPECTROPATRONM_62 [Streptomyces phage Spectropatronm]QEQ93755.1 hypothetical protein SEA_JAYLOCIRAPTOR_62 [Streptomyces phage Jaylociraptor]QEQ93841.1 hypothetical protein SEA_CHERRYBLOSSOM_62 [Streptomyces phage CherryBlossom]QEQ94007.1 hypothetical protein SEA_MEIBYSRARUS_60 [Streptomyces phage Meibysrarus]QNN98227.1 hypothetical protein SEA_MAYA_62 [Streptomyces phage Maya]
MGRNIFESNEDLRPETMPDGQPYILLPKLEEGLRWELERLPDGRSVVVIKGGIN